MAGWGKVMTAGLCLWAAAATAQPLTLAEARARLPDADRYSLAVENEGLAPDAVQELAALIAGAIGKDHFYGAVAAHLPAGGTRLAISMRLARHSGPAAERAVLADCEADRPADASPCRIIARILPETPPEDPIEVSSAAAHMLAGLPDDAEGPVHLALSGGSAAWAAWLGQGSQASALEECNTAATAAGGPADCEIVVNDAR